MPQSLGYDSQKRMFLHAVRGSVSTVILTMILCPDLRGPGALASACGMNRKTVRKCLYDLEALGFVLRGSRYEAWVLAPGTRQMLLGEDGGDGYILPTGSSSSPCIDALVDSQDSETTTTGADGYILPTLPELVRSETVLIELGCSPDAALSGLRGALELGGGAGEIERRVVGWRTYCSSDRGKSIMAPGFLIAKRVGQGVDAPGVPAETRDEEATRYLEGMWEEIVQH